VQGNYVICLQYLRQMRPINFQPGFLLSIICTPSLAVGFRTILKDNVQLNNGKEEPPIKYQLFYVILIIIIILNIFPYAWSYIRLIIRIHVLDAKYFTIVSSNFFFFLGSKQA
jgi:hypothetical protein